MFSRPSGGYTVNFCLRPVILYNLRPHIPHYTSFTSSDPNRTTNRSKNSIVSNNMLTSYPKADIKGNVQIAHPRKGTRSSHLQLHGVINVVNRVPESQVIWTSSRIQILQVARMAVIFSATLQDRKLSLSRFIFY